MITNSFFAGPNSNGAPGLPNTRQLFQARLVKAPYDAQGSQYLQDRYEGCKSAGAIGAKKVCLERLEKALPSVKWSSCEEV
jgi:hypothetical protein